MESSETAPARSGICIVFSKDRALQLDAALRSLQESCAEKEDLRPHVLFAATSEVDRRQYDEVAVAHPDVRLVEEAGFQATLTALLADTKFVLFVVDDTLFTAPWSLRESQRALEADDRLIGVSLRLGQNTQWCYSLNQPQAVPPMRPIRGDLVSFEWSGATGDFGYPLEVSSSLYRTDDIRDLLHGATFRNPNQLEDTLHRGAARLQERRPLLASFSQSRAFSNPLNVVQQEFPNRHAETLGWTASILRRMFDAGVRIDIASCWGLVTKACHEEQPLSFVYPKVGPLAARIGLSVEGPGLPAGVISIDEHCDWELPVPAEKEDVDVLYLLGMLSRLAKKTEPHWLSRLAALIAESGDAIEREAAATAAWRARLTQTISELIDYQKELIAARDELIVRARQLNDTIAKQGAILALGAREIAQRQEVLEQLQRQLETVSRSKSWRFTRPLRGAKYAARGIRDRTRQIAEGKVRFAGRRAANGRTHHGVANGPIDRRAPFVSSIEVAGPSPSAIRWQAQTLASIETLASVVTPDDLAKRLADASGKYLCLVSGTRDLEPNALERMVAALEANPAVPAIAARGEAGADGVSDAPQPWAVLVRPTAQRRLLRHWPPLIPRGMQLSHIFAENAPTDKGLPTENGPARSANIAIAPLLDSPLRMLIDSVRLRPATTREPVLAIVPWLPVGGAEALLYRIIAGLSDEYEFIVVTTLPEQHAWHARFREQVPCIYHLPDFVPFPLWNDFLLLKIAERGIHRILTSGSEFGYRFLPQAKAYFPEISTFALLHNDEWRGHRANALRARASIDRMIAVSDRIAATLQYLDGVDGARIATIRNGVDAEKSFSPGAVSRDAARRELSLPDDGPIVAFIGRLSAEKNPAAFIEMIDRHPRGGDVAFAIFGEGPLDELVRQEQAAGGDAVAFRWIRHVAPGAMPTVYGAIDLLVITSNSEGLPLVLLEAMAMEVPTVAYDVGDIAATIENGVSGIVVGAGDLEALTTEVQRLIDDPEARKVMGKAARTRLIALGLTEQLMLTQYRETLRYAVVNPPAPADAPAEP